MITTNSTTNEASLREEIAAIGRAFRMLGMAPGTSGNISARLDDGWLMTPTNTGLGALAPDDIAKLDWDGHQIAGKPPSKELFLHRAFYETRPDTGAVIHLHATYATAVSCLANLDPRSCLPPMTAYFVMRVGRLPLLPYYRPGDPALGEAIRDDAADHAALLLANHGPVVAGPTLDAARNAIEELEETAKLFLLLRSHKIHTLDDNHIEALRQRFGVHW